LGSSPIGWDAVSTTIFFVTANLLKTERVEWMAKARRAKRRKRVFMVRVANTAVIPKPAF
jgi:hypothetical protein